MMIEYGERGGGDAGADEYLAIVNSKCDIKMTYTDLRHLRLWWHAHANFYDDYVHAWRVAWTTAAHTREVRLNCNPLRPELT